MRLSAGAKFSPLANFPSASLGGCPIISESSELDFAFDDSELYAMNQTAVAASHLVTLLGFDPFSI